MASKINSNEDISFPSGSPSEDHNHSYGQPDLSYMENGANSNHLNGFSQFAKKRSSSNPFARPSASPCAGFNQHVPPCASFYQPTPPCSSCDQIFANLNPYTILEFPSMNNNDANIKFLDLNLPPMSQPYPLDDQHSDDDHDIGEPHAKKRVQEEPVVNVNEVVIKASQWTSIEDSDLRELVKKRGKEWTEWSHIAQELGNKLRKQCKENPGIKKHKWTTEEDMIIVEAHKKIGNCWAEMVRTDSDVKNRWNSTLRTYMYSRNGKSIRRRSTSRNVGSTPLMDYIATLFPPGKSVTQVKKPSPPKQPPHSSGSGLGMEWDPYLFPGSRLIPKSNLSMDMETLMPGGAGI